MHEAPEAPFETSPLHRAAEAGDLSLCQKLVSEGFSIASLDEYGWTPLIHAVQGDHLGVAHYFLQQGASNHFTYQREDTPEARKKEDEKHVAISEQLNLPDSMRKAFKDLPPDLLEEVVNKKAMREMRESMVDLHFAPSSEHAINHASSIPMLELLVVEHNADINHIDQAGYWPLSSFAESGDLAAIRWLLDHGAKPNNTSTGETAIFKAIRDNQLEMIALLIERGAEVNVQDVDGWTPLFACPSVEAAKFLIEQGADPTITDQCDFSCWHWTEDPATRDFLKASAAKHER